VTASERGWATLLNGDLLRAAEGAGFDVLLTTDTNLPYQQDLTGRRLAVVIIRRAKWKLIQAKLDAIVAAMESAKPGSFAFVEFPPSGSGSASGL
jgi:hypothetical protein